MQILRSKRQALFWVYLMYTISHLAFITLPPKGTHLWRQCNTSAVSRNFYEEDMNILKPRVDRRRNTTGITGMQFPSFEFTVALFSKLVGQHQHWFNRLVAFLFFGIGIWYFYHWVRILANDATAFWASWGFIWSPSLYYHSISALPDILALTASVAALYYFYSLIQQFNRTKLIALCFFLALAGLTKIQYLLVGTPMLVITISKVFKGDWKPGEMLSVMLAGALPIALTLWWYAYAIKLRESSGLEDFGLEVRYVTDFKEALIILKENMLEIFPELIVGYAALLGFIYFVFTSKSIRGPFKETVLPYSVWLILMLVYHLLELQQMKDHVYYMYPYFPLVLLVTAIGLNRLVQRKLIWLYVFILLMPIAAFFRVFHHWTNTPPEQYVGLYEIDNQEFKSIIPPNALTIVGPDQSGCVYHYFTHTKGFTFEDQNQLIGCPDERLRLKTYIDESAEYFILGNDEEVFPEVRVFLDEVVFDEHGIRIYKIKTNKTD